MPLNVSRISHREALSDIQPSEAPPGVPQSRWNQTMPKGRREGKELAWRRGHQAGLVDAVLTLQEMGYTRAVERLMAHHGLTEDGALSSAKKRL